MTRHLLDNAQWGFESSCFVCEPSNPAGLRIQFVHDDEAAVVEADFCLGTEFSGAPRYIHGGLVLAILDEAMAWGAIALGGTFALTRSTSATFWRPVGANQAHRVVARLAAQGPDGLDLSALVSRAGDGQPCVRAEARFVGLTAGPASRAIGAEVGAADADHLRHPSP